jgi:hypothetical protein
MVYNYAPQGSLKLGLIMGTLRKKVDRAIADLTINAETIFILNERLHFIKKEYGDFSIKVWRIDYICSTPDITPDITGVCYGSERDAVLFMLPEQDIEELNKKTIQVDINELYELIITNGCFTIDDGAMLYNINQGSTDEEDDQDTRYLIEAFWEEDGEERELYVIWSDVTKIEYNYQWGVFHIFRKSEEHTIALKILETISVIPKGVEDAK